MKTLTVDQKSMDAASADQFDLDPIAADLTLPLSTGLIRCGEINGHGFIISTNYQPSDALLTINLGENGPLTALSQGPREEALSRLVRAATRIATGRTRSIPNSWLPYHHANRLSFQADRYVRHQSGGRSDAGRVVVRIDAGGRRIFAYLLDRDGVRDLALLPPPEDKAEEALSLLADFLSIPNVSLAVGDNSVDLLPTLTPKTADEWYDTRFTPDQRSFVDNFEEGGLRLVGAAGTGKTRTLVVKALRMLLHDAPALKFDRILFLTHAYRTVQDVEEMVMEMEPNDGVRLLADERPRLSVQTIYTLAQNAPGHDSPSISSISIDGHEGREYQAMLLNEVVDEFVNGDWVTYRGTCSPPLRDYVEAAPNSPTRRFFLWEVLNEFACVLDAEGVRTDVSRRKSYIANNTRKNWMWPLPKREDRAVVVALYDLFRARLRRDRLIGTDQMITDYIGHLDSFRWEAMQPEEGYDAVFVDELHLFNRQERMVFRHMVRNVDEAPRVYMAYDAKQSPRDTFLQLPSMDSNDLDLWNDAKLKKVPKIELNSVFRYTPQIAHALKILDDEYPGQNLGEDWQPFAAVSQIADGPKPTLYVLPSASATYGQVFKRARDLQAAAKKGVHVAVLCLSPDNFLRYLDRSELREHFVAITSRDDAAGSLKSRKKFVFSMPEYVGGLQFDTVLLIDVNKDEVPEGAMTSNARRHFASRLYTGAGRAEQRLEIYAASDSGGAAPLLSRAVARGCIVEVGQMPA
jgi:hypothetical protein